MKELFRQCVLAGRFEDAYSLFMRMDFLVASGVLIGLAARTDSAMLAHFVDYALQYEESRRLRQLRSAIAQNCRQRGVS